MCEDEVCGCGKAAVTWSGGRTSMILVKTQNLAAREESKQKEKNPLAKE